MKYGTQLLLTSPMPGRLWILCLRADSKITLRLLHIDSLKHQDNMPACRSFRICPDSLGSFRFEDAQPQGIPRDPFDLFVVLLILQMLSDIHPWDLLKFLYCCLFSLVLLSYFSGEIFLTLPFITSNVWCCLLLQALLRHFSFYCVFIFVVNVNLGEA